MRHPVDDFKSWQPTYASYVLKDFDKVSSQEQAIIEMVGEAGEVLQVMTKARRKEELPDREKILDELGDTFWGLCGVMNTFGISFHELTTYNMRKLDERYKNKGVGR